MYTTWHSSAWLPGVTFRCLASAGRTVNQCSFRWNPFIRISLPSNHCLPPAAGTEQYTNSYRPPHSRFCHGIHNRTDTTFHQYSPSPGGQASCPGFSVTGWSSDSIPEAIESSHEYPIWGVQFHPEALATAGDTAFLCQSQTDTDQR